MWGALAEAPTTAPTRYPLGYPLGPHPGVSPQRHEVPLGSASSLAGLEAEGWMPVRTLLHRLLGSPSAECQTEKGQGHRLADGVTRPDHPYPVGGSPKFNPQASPSTVQDGGWGGTASPVSKKRRWSPLHTRR